MADLHTARAKAQDRLKSAFESIFARYDRAFDDECDEVDLSTGNLLVDRGFFRNWDAHQFGDCSDDAHSDSDSADALATSPGHWPPLVAAHSSYSTTTPTRSIITPTPNKRPWLTPTCPPDELVQGLHTLLSTTPTKPFVANPSVLASDPPFLQQLPRTPKARQRRTVPSTIAAIRYRADEVAEDELLDSDLSCALTNIIAATRSRLKLGSGTPLTLSPARTPPRVTPPSEHNGCLTSPQRVKAVRKRGSSDTKHISQSAASSTAKRPRTAQATGCNSSSVQSLHHTAVQSILMASPSRRLGRPLRRCYNPFTALDSPTSSKSADGVQQIPGQFGVSREIALSNPLSKPVDPRQINQNSPQTISASAVRLVLPTDQEPLGLSGDMGSRSGGRSLTGGHCTTYQMFQNDQSPNWLAKASPAQRQCGVFTPTSPITSHVSRTATSASPPTPLMVSPPRLITAECSGPGECTKPFCFKCMVRN